MFDEQGRKIDCEALVINATFDGDIMTYIGNNLRYPTEAKRKKTEGKVSVEFMINENGKISDVEVVKGIGDGCDEEAVRLISQMPSWQPLVIDGIPQKTHKTVPIVFWLQDK